MNLIKCPSQSLFLKVTVCIIVFLWWDWRIINSFEAFCLLKVFFFCLVAQLLIVLFPVCLPIPVQHRTALFACESLLLSLLWNTSSPACLGGWQIPEAVSEHLSLEGEKSCARPGAVRVWVLGLCAGSLDSCKRMSSFWRTPGLDGKLITHPVKYLRVFYVTTLIQGTRTSAFQSLCIHLLKQIFVFLFHAFCVVSGKWRTIPWKQSNY